jgi:hypothetical protein
VRIRSRKPCFLWRRRLFGWKVRLLTRGSSAAVGLIARFVGLQARYLASRAASGPPQRGPIRARPVRPGRTRSGQLKRDEMAGTRLLRRCDSTSERYGLPGHAVKRSRCTRTPHRTDFSRLEGPGMPAGQACAGMATHSGGRREHVASLRGRTLVSSGRADQRPTDGAVAFPSPTCLARRVFASLLRDLRAVRRRQFHGLLHRASDAHTQRVDNSVDNS